MHPLEKLQDVYHKNFKNTGGPGRDLPEDPVDSPPSPSSVVPPLFLCGLGPPRPPPRFNTEPSPASRWKQQQQEASQLTDPSPAAWKTRKKSRGEEYSNFGGARER